MAWPEAPPKDIESGSIRNAADHGQGELEVGKIQQGNKVLRKMRAAESWLDRKFRVEGMGAERVLVQDRKHPHVFFVSCGFSKHTSALIVLCVANTVE